MLIELYEGFFINPEQVAVVKAVDEGQCALFTAGQSAVDEGFLVPYSAQEVFEQLNDAEQEFYDNDDEDEPPEKPEES
jgi:hypothetical protein